MAQPARTQRGARAPPVVIVRWPRAGRRASTTGGIQPGNEVRGIRRGKLTHQEGEVSGKAGPAGMHRGGGTTTGRRGRLKTTTLRWRVAPAVVGGLRGKGSGTATRAKERGEGRWRRGRSGRVTGVREKNPAGDGGGALSNLAMRGGNGGGGGSGSGSATRHKADVGSGPDRRAARGQGREPVSWPRGGGETGSDRPVDDARPAVARDRRVRAAWLGHAVRSAEQGRGNGADQWATAIVPGGGTG
jgi:hypothetical protein